MGTRGAARYRARDPRRRALRSLVLDHVEDFARQQRGPSDKRPRPSRSTPEAFLRFLECGIMRFGAVRYRCEDCREDLFVAFSCRRRLACPSCDSKRACIESALAMDGLLPAVPYRQWVLVIPKRLRWFVNRDAALAGELSRLLGEELARFYGQRTGSLGAPTQWTAIQRFGSRVNLHVHLHSVVSDGAFEMDGKGSLRFIPAAPPSLEDVARLTEGIRQRWTRRLLRRGAIPEETAQELLMRRHSGFSLHGSVRVEAQDRAALERLLVLLISARPVLLIVPA